MAVPGRGNGLEATAYVPLADLDPQLADAMLEVLREEGVAAYAVPAGTRGAADLAVPPYHRPLDRLHVDRDAADRARLVLDTRLPQMRAELDRRHGAHAPDGPDADPLGSMVDDDIWADIVASLSATDDAPVGRWPAAEDLPDEARPGEGRGRLLRRAGPAAEPDDGGAGVGSPAEPSAPPPRAEPVDAADHDHYVPPPPPPLPTADAVTRFAWAGLLGGVLFFFLAAVLQFEVSSGAALLAVAAFVAGFVTLVARSKDRPPHDDAGPDDGAVV